jgi:hypothetical protein
MTLTLGIIGVLWRAACIGLLILLLTELRWAQRHDGDTLRSLRAVFASQVFVLLFPFLASIDAYTDMTPGFDLRPYAEQWVWIAYAVFATCLARFWLALHRWARGKEKESHDSH